VVFGKLMFCFIPISSAYIFGTLLTANGNLKELNLLAASGMCINIVLNIIMIPLFRAEGSAVSSLITQSLMAVAQIAMVKKIFRFHINYRLILSVLALIIFTVIICWLTKQFISYWFAGILTAGASGMVAAFLLRIIRVRNIYRLIRYE
jgi:O-antigen/teichoic acid export membrane protein